MQTLNRKAAQKHYKTLRKKLVRTTIGQIAVDDLEIRPDEPANKRCWVIGKCPNQHWVKVRLASLRYMAKHGAIGCQQCRTAKARERAPLSWADQHAKKRRAWKKHPRSIFRDGEWWDATSIVTAGLQCSRFALSSWSRPGRRFPARIARQSAPGPAGHNCWYYKRTDWLALQAKMNGVSTANGGADQLPASHISSHISQTKKPRKAYKGDDTQRLIKCIKRHRRRGKEWRECFEEAAAEFGLKLSATKMRWYRSTESHFE
ncbi:MAG: hypothetical protein L0Y72_23620 [Gemmataceae bacterium]|nr:hypothetical protein [Gemmataceae bacterium]MCI0742034.1 hypothetical protein [Gemmataceae bacterium]